jgi:hypothetical protein
MDSLNDQTTADQPEAEPTLAADHPPTIDIEAAEQAAIDYYDQWYGVAPIEVPTIGPSLKDDLWQATAFNAERPDGNGYSPADDRDTHSILTQSAWDAGFEALDPTTYRALGADGPEPGRAD